MSGLRERLNRLRPNAERGEPETSSASRGEAGMETDNSSQPDREIPADAEQWSRLGAVYQENEHGRFLLRVNVYPLDHRHGNHAFRDLLPLSGGLAPLVHGSSPDPAGRQGGDLQADQLLFLDSETTGLGLGAGNVPFMLGMGYFVQDRFVVEQAFMRNPGEEAAMLSHVCELLGRRPVVVSYNGRSFDWPVIKNRLVLHRMEQAEADPSQIDFLHPSRSLWKHTLPSCRLGQVEEDRLGVTRSGDVPGSMAPQLYFLYLAEKRPDVLRGVFEHNERDILSLASLAVHFAKALNGDAEPSALSAVEAYRLGLWLYKCGQRQLAENVFGHLLGRNDRDLHAVLPGLARHYKKNKAYERAAAIWRRCLDGRDALEACTELAMYYEHRMKDPATALQYADRAGQLISRLRALSRRDPRMTKQQDEVHKRIRRLERKLACLSV